MGLMEKTGENWRKLEHSKEPHPVTGRTWNKHHTERLHVVQDLIVVRQKCYSLDILVDVFERTAVTLTG